jgi:hypothetical protein
LADSCQFDKSHPDVEFHRFDIARLFAKCQLAEERNTVGAIGPWEISDLELDGPPLAERSFNFADRAAESSVIGEHLLARFGELEPFDFGRSPATYDALGVLGDESDAHQPPQLVGREAMHKHDRFGAAFGTAAREQHDSAALMGLEDSTAGPRHGAIT